MSKPGVPLVKPRRDRCSRDREAAQNSDRIMAAMAAAADLPWRKLVARASSGTCMEKVTEGRDGHAGTVAGKVLSIFHLPDRLRSLTEKERRHGSSALLVRSECMALRIITGAPSKFIVCYQETDVAIAETVIACRIAAPKRCRRNCRSACRGKQGSSATRGVEQRTPDIFHREHRLRPGDLLDGESNGVPGR